MGAIGRVPYRIHSFSLAPGYSHGCSLFFDAQGELLAISELAWPVSCRSIRSSFLAAHGRHVRDCVERRSAAIATSRMASPCVYDDSLCFDHNCVAVSDHGKISLS